MIENKQRFMNELLLRREVIVHDSFRDNKGNASDAFEAGFKSCLEKFAPDLEVWSVQIWTPKCVTLQVQNRDSLEEWVKSRIQEAIKPEPWGNPSLPRSVLVKMVHKRILRAKNLSTVGRFEWARVDFKTCTIESLTELCNTISSSPNTFNTKQTIELMKFINRSDVDESILRSACDLLLIEEVTNS